MLLGALSLASVPVLARPALAFVRGEAEEDVGTLKLTDIMTRLAAEAELHGKPEKHEKHHHLKSIKAVFHRRSESRERAASPAISAS